MVILHLQIHLILKMVDECSVKMHIYSYWIRYTGESNLPFVSINKSYGCEWCNWFSFFVLKWPLFFATIAHSNVCVCAIKILPLIGLYVFACNRLCIWSIPSNGIDIVNRSLSNYITNVCRQTVRTWVFILFCDICNTVRKYEIENRE